MVLTYNLPVNKLEEQAKCSLVMQPICLYCRLPAFPQEVYVICNKSWDFDKVSSCFLRLWWGKVTWLVLFLLSASVTPSHETQQIYLCEWCLPFITHSASMHKLNPQATSAAVFFFFFQMWPCVYPGWHSTDLTWCLSQLNVIFSLQKCIWPCWFLFWCSHWPSLPLTME